MARAQAESNIEKQNVESLIELRLNFELIRFTRNAWSHKSLDAREEVRRFLRDSGVHDYDEQIAGSGRSVRVTAFIVPPRAKPFPATLNFSKSAKPDRRIWIPELPQVSNAGDLIGLVMWPEGLGVVNLTPELLSVGPIMTDQRWSSESSSFPASPEAEAEYKRNELGPFGREWSQYSTIPVEASNVDAYVRQRESSEEREALRVEAGLVKRYVSWLNVNQGASAVRQSIPSESGEMFTDLFVVESGELIEAKSSTTRAQLRLALGQILDYARYVEYKSLAVLVPQRPLPEMVSLLAAHGIGCIWELEGRSGFDAKRPYDRWTDARLEGSQPK